MKKSLLVVLFFSIGFFSRLPAQDLTGIWRGYFNADNGDHYKYEVQLTQSKKGSLSGVTYSYFETRFYAKTTFTGNFTKATKAALVQEVKSVEIKMDLGSVACIMKCRLVYDKSGKEEVLEGVYSSSYEKSDLLNGVKRGGGCGGGQVFLHKVPTSDFYEEPFLRNKKIATPPATGVAKATPPKKPATKTPAKTPPQKPDAVAKKPDTKPIITTPETKPPATEVTVKPKPVEPKIIPTPAIIRDRKNELTKTLTVTHNEIDISLYDNGEIDGDTVSIYLDGKLILANKGLSNTPIKYQLKLDETNPEHTLVMVAENMGSIPPNTSLMLIQDGDKRYQVSITSTEQKNAMVRFRYEKP